MNKRNKRKRLRRLSSAHFFRRFKSICFNREKLFAYYFSGINVFHTNKTARRSKSFCSSMKFKCLFAHTIFCRKNKRMNTKNPEANKRWKKKSWSDCMQKHKNTINRIWWFKIWWFSAIYSWAAWTFDENSMEKCDESNSTTLNRVELSMNRKLSRDKERFSFIVFNSNNCLCGWSGSSGFLYNFFLITFSITVDDLKLNCTLAYRIKWRYQCWQKIEKKK